MTEDEALRVMAPLVIAFPFKADEVDLGMVKMKGLTDPEAAQITADRMIDEVESLRAPQWSVFRKSYDRQWERLEEQRNEKRLELESGGRLAGMISPKEGRQIAAAAYAKHYKRRPPADIFSLPDPEYVPSAQHEEIEKALNVIRGGYEHDGMIFSRYTDVLKAFDGHQLTARAAVKALVDSGMLIHHPNGTLLLRRAA
jgi:hypothetical protein